MVENREPVAKEYGIKDNWRRLKEVELKARLVFFVSAGDADDRDLREASVDNSFAD